MPTRCGGFAMAFLLQRGGESLVLSIAYVSVTLDGWKATSNAQSTLHPLSIRRAQAVFPSRCRLSVTVQVTATWRPKSKASDQTAVRDCLGARRGALSTTTCCQILTA